MTPGMRLKTPVSLEPVSVTELAWNLRLVTDPEEEYVGPEAVFLQSLISAAREDAEHYTGRHWATKCIALSFKSFSEPLRLPSDVIDIVDISYFNVVGDLLRLAFDGNSFTVADVGRGECELCFLSHYLAATPLPQTMVRPDAVTIECIVGQPSYEDIPYTPPTVRQAILMIASHWYENRESVGFVETKAVAQSYGWLLDSHKIYGVG